MKALKMVTAVGFFVVYLCGQAGATDDDIKYLVYDIGSFLGIAVYAEALYESECGELLGRNFKSEKAFSILKDKVGEYNLALALSQIDNNDLLKQKKEATSYIREQLRNSGNRESYKMGTCASVESNIRVLYEKCLNDIEAKMRLNKYYR